MREGGQWPCAVYRENVGCNPVLYGQYGRLVHKRCSRVKSSWQDVANFRYTGCISAYVACVRLGRVSVGDVYCKCADDFCSLGDVISVGGVVESSSLARDNYDWKKFRELLPLLMMRELSRLAKGKVFAACVRSAVFKVVKHGHI